MLVHSIRRPWPLAYATAIDRGAWQIERCHEPDGAIVWFRARQPLILEWDPGDRWSRNPTTLGDIVHAGGRIALRRQVAEVLRIFTGWDPSPVELLPGPRELAFDNDVLREIWVTAFLSADMSRSTYVEGARCLQCETRTFLLTGIQESPLDVLLWEPGHPFATERKSRKPGHGLYVREADLEGASIFRVNEFGGVMVTEEVVEFVKARGFTNVEFREVGETF